MNKLDATINKITNGIISSEILGIIDRDIGIMLKCTKNFKLTKKLAMFDLDNTIIFNKSKKRFFEDKDDWDLIENSKKYITKLHNDGYSIIIISNQTGLKNNNSRCDMFCERLNNIINKLNVPLIFLAALSNNIFKKPSPAFYTKVILKIVNPTEVFYCGDAAGRKTDFSNSDILFANNCMIKFYTPEKLFKLKNNKQNFPTVKNKNLDFCKSGEFEYKKKYNKELILMFGFPASGKSTVAKILSKYHNFVLLSNDIHKSKFKKFLEENLSKGDNIVIDNTNLSIESRKKIIDLSNKFNYKIRCFVMNTSYEESIHNNFYRAYTSDRELVSLTAYKFMKKNFSYPKENEGIHSIEKISHNFVNTFEYAYYFPL